jgi:hypothetical protein
MDAKTQVVKVALNKDTVIAVEATVLAREEDVAAGIMSFDAVSDALREISKIVVSSLDSIKPKKAKVEFGLEVAVDSGKLTAMLVKGSGKASLTVTLEWDGQTAQA